jgi:arylformamidase
MSESFNWRSLSACELERQFNPRVTVPDFETYLLRSAQASETARAKLDRCADIRYGVGPRQLIDVYPVAAPNAPALIYVHGGFWRALSKERSAGVALSLHAAGIVTIVVGYDLCPQVSLDRVIAQIHEALQWCGQRLPQFSVDMRRVHVAGSSAGAHLLAMSLMREPAPELNICSAWLASGIYDLEPVMSISVNSDVNLDPHSCVTNSPMSYVRRIAPKIVVAVGDQESRAWIAQSERFARASTACGNDVAYRLVSGANHFSIGIATPGAALNNEMLASVLAPD